ncbi:PaaI family thioesterase [Desulfatibacillum aliphaticivorans]|uniref:PaaI family thioesterase n=1 Tax=Desulfatibacillum aliphaticivorans TaxID=218208 RepID=UPI0004067E9A|nr:PaaI family thioesterase [Desulfatibacillum aliphaticivorans]
MEETQRIPLPNLEGYNCFACGSANPIGLHMHFFLEGDKVVSDLVLGQNLAGWENLVHGGIISTLMDEIVGWTVITLKRKFFVTRSLNIRYLRPIPVGSKVRVQGKFRSESENGRATIDALLLGPDGRKSATGKAEVAFLSEKRIKEIPESHQKDMNWLFEQLEAAFNKSALAE